MNVDDIALDQIPTDFSKEDRLSLMFKRQHALAERYLPIEEKNGLLQTKDMPVNLNDRYGQARLKDFFWRVTEELTEAIDAKRNHEHLPQHCLEEIIDSLHFLIEACLLAGLRDGDVQILPMGTKCRLEEIRVYYDKFVPVPSLERGAWEVVQAIGNASNCLKQRPWKNTHQLTDERKFKDNLVDAFHKLIYLCALAGMTTDDIFRFYWKKSEVNKFRQRSNY